MDEASHLLEDIVVSKQQLLTGYNNISIDQPLVDILVYLVPSSVDLVNQVVGLVPSSIDLTLSPLESEVQVVDPIPSSVVNPTLSPLESEVQVVDLIPSSVDPTLPLKNELNTA
jgi:hypothetical protein